MEPSNPNNQRGKKPNEEEEYYEEEYDYGYEQQHNPVQQQQNLQEQNAHDNQYYAYDMPEQFYQQEALQVNMNDDMQQMRQFLQQHDDHQYYQGHHYNPYHQEEEKLGEIPYVQQEQYNFEDANNGAASGLDDWDQFREQIEAAQIQQQQPDLMIVGQQMKILPSSVEQQNNQANIAVDSDLEMKDALIKKEILEKGHAPQEFEYYLQNVKSDSKDLKKWGLKELKAVIQEFQDHQFALCLYHQENSETSRSSSLIPQQKEGKEKPKPTSQMKANAVIQQNPLMSTAGQPIIQNQNLPKIMPFLRPYEHGPFLQVTQLKPSILNKNIRNIKVKLLNPRVTQQTEFLFIKTNQVEFTIQTTPMKWEVVRSENDIYFLRKLLQMQFPHMLIPPLPSKLETKYTQRSMQKRCLKINRFFAAVCRNEEFCTYQVLVEFLMIKHKEMKTFTEKMKQEEATLAKQRVAGKPDINELSSMYEKIYTNLIPEAVSFDLPQFIERFETLCKDLIVDGQQIRDKSNLLHQSYLKFQEVLMKISQFHQNDSLGLLEAYANMSKVMGTDAFIIQQQGEEIFNAMYFLKYNIEFVHTMRNMQEKVEFAKQRFLKAEKTFLAKREKLVGQVGQQNSAKISQTQIDSLLPVETAELERSTQFMNFFTNQVFQEVRRMQNQMEFPGMHDNFNELTKKVTNGLNQRSFYWSGMLNALSNDQQQQPQRTKQ